MIWFLTLIQVLGLLGLALIISKYIIIIQKKRKGVKTEAVIDKMVQTGSMRTKITKWYAHYEYNGKQYYSYFVDPPLAHYEGDKVEIVLVADNPEEIFINDYLEDVTIIVITGIGFAGVLVGIIRWFL